MLKKVILHLCADIGSDSWFYANDDEYEVIKVGKEIGVENYTPPDNVYGVIAKLAFHVLNLNAVKFWGDK